MNAKVLVDYDWEDAQHIHHHIESHGLNYLIVAFWPDEKLYVINLGETRALFAYDQVIPLGE